MERTNVFKIVAALGAAFALVALGALLPKPPAPPVSVVVGQASFAPSSPDPGFSPDPVGGQATLAPPGSIHVYVCGAVHRPGVYSLPAGERIVDAIAQAGGAAENADLEQLNLAEPLADAMKVDVPLKGRQLAISAVSAGSMDSGGSSRRSGAGRHRSSRGGSHKLSAGQTIDVNTASEAELVQLPGVGPSLARRIVEYRAANGPFQMADDLQNVAGIGASKFAKIEPFVRV